MSRPAALRRASVRPATAQLFLGLRDQDRQTAQAPVVHVVMRAGYLVKRIADGFEIIENA